MNNFLAKHQITQVTQPLYSPDLVPCDFWFFPKLKSPLKGKRFQAIDEIQQNTIWQLMVIGRTVWGPKEPPKETEASLSYVQCFLYLVSSSINVSICHITWLDTCYYNMKQRSQQLESISFLLHKDLFNLDSNNSPCFLHWTNNALQQNLTLGQVCTGNISLIPI